MRRALLLGACLTFAACAHTGAAPASTRAASALVLVRCDVPDATIWVDERPIAEIRDARGGLRLHVGAHHLEIRHDRFHTRYFELSLLAGETRTLDVALAEVLD